MEAMRLEDSATRRADFGGRLGRVLFNDYWGAGRKVGLEPSSFLVTLLDEGSRIDSHFHDVDQFQVTVRGGGRIGVHPMNSVTVHYADAYAPYGPIVPSDQGMSFFTLRMLSAGGTWGMPGGRSAMPPGRPVKARRNVVVPLPLHEETLPDGEVQTDYLIAPDEDGLAVAALRLGPGAGSPAPASAGDQYILVCTGALLYGGRFLGPESLVLVRRGEPALVLQTGQEGATLLALQFPLPSDRPGSNPEAFAGRSESYVNGFSYTEIGE